MLVSYFRRRIRQNCRSGDLNLDLNFEIEKVKLTVAPSASSVSECALPFATLIDDTAVSVKMSPPASFSALAIARETPPIPPST